MKEREKLKLLFFFLFSCFLSLKKTRAISNQANELSFAQAHSV